MLREYKNRIRPIAISIVRNKEAVLAYQRQDDITNKKFYRLVGGCIEFGEKSDEALSREFLEELSLELTNIKLITSFESIFEFNNEKLHEIVYLFESQFVDKSTYHQEKISGLEGNRAFEAKWISVNDLLSEKYIIFPKEILKYL